MLLNSWKSSTRQANSLIIHHNTLDRFCARIPRTFLQLTMLNASCPITRRIRLGTTHSTGGSLIAARWASKSIEMVVRDNLAFEAAGTRNKWDTLSASSILIGRVSPAA